MTAAWVLAGLVAALLFGLGVLAYNVPVYENSKQRSIKFSEEL